MSEIIINKNDIKAIVESYKNVNATFVIKTFIDGEKQKKCCCFINGKECTIVFYIKANSITIQPIGKNIAESNLLISYISSKGFSTAENTKTITFQLKNETFDELKSYIINECKGIISFNEQRKDLITLTGYNGDVLTFTFFPTTKKAMIQGKPFHVFSIITTFLAGLEEFNFDEVVNWNNVFIGVNTSSTLIRADMKIKLGNTYGYLDEALLRSISGSFSMLKQNGNCEDYTGCLTGIFKALEGYLKKILNQKYNYYMTKNSSFSMFHKEGTQSAIDKDTNISQAAKQQLIKLYNCYNNKRNVYLHSSVDPSQTRIIQTITEARDLASDILTLISESYDVIFA